MYGDVFGRHPTARDPSQEDASAYELARQRAYEELENAAVMFVSEMLPHLRDDDQLDALGRKVAAVLEELVEAAADEAVDQARRDARWER